MVILFPQAIIGSQHPPFPPPTPWPPKPATIGTTLRSGREILQSEFQMKLKEIPTYRAFVWNEVRKRRLDWDLDEDTHKLLCTAVTLSCREQFAFVLSVRLNRLTGSKTFPLMLPSACLPAAILLSPSHRRIHTCCVLLLFCCSLYINPHSVSPQPSARFKQNST